MEPLKENIEDLQKKRDMLNSLYRAGKISPRYNQHLRLVLESFKIMINHLQHIYEENSVPLSKDDLKKISDREIKPLLLLYSLFSDKIEKEMQGNDKALESIAMDFFRMNALPGIDTMVIIEEGGIKLKARVEFIQVYLKDGSRNASKNAPIIVVNDKLVKYIRNWILILHETSHLLKTFEDCLKTNNPRLYYECELFSDLYSTHIAGYAYVNALIQYAKNNNDDPYICTQTHPSLAFRVKITLDHLKRQSTAAIGEHTINKLETDWISWLDNAGYRGPTISHEYRAESSALRKLDDAIKELGVSNSYKELIERIKMIEDNLYVQLTPIELLNYVSLSGDFGKPMIDEGEVKNIIVEWSKERYGR